MKANPGGLKPSFLPNAINEIDIMNLILSILFLLSPKFNQTDMELSVDREVMWCSLDGKKFEHVQLRSNKEGILADGLIIHLDAGSSYRIRYRIQCDSAWQVRKVHLQLLGTSSHELLLHADGKGNWKDKEGHRIEMLDGARDVDIHFSPFTNTLAIRRLKLQQGMAVQTQVVFINVPDLSVEMARQQYTRITDKETGRRYRYESLTSGFKTELPVDEDGLLIEYPQYFERLWTR